MTEQDLNRYAEQEVSWLKYYGKVELRQIDEFNDVDFYDRLMDTTYESRMETLKYTKRVLPLPLRCAAGFITSKLPVLESSIEDLELTSEPRSHENNIYTPLEYVLAKNWGQYENLRTILRS